MLCGTQHMQSAGERAYREQCGRVCARLHALDLAHAVVFKAREDNFFDQAELRPNFACPIFLF
jgi:hypothetical protein